MAIYEYLCSNTECNGITERIQSIHAERPEQIACQFCNSVANFQVSRSAVLTGGLTTSPGTMTNTPGDVEVGKASAARWSDIHKRQDARNKVRVANNQQGLAATGYETFTPISSEQKSVRTRALNHVEKDGYKPELWDPMTRAVNKAS